MTASPKRMERGEKGAGFNVLPTWVQPKWLSSPASNVRLHVNRPSTTQKTALRISALVITRPVPMCPREPFFSPSFQYPPQGEACAFFPLGRSEPKYLFSLALSRC